MLYGAPENLTGALLNPIGPNWSGSSTSATANWVAANPNSNQETNPMPNLNDLVKNIEEILSGDPVLQARAAANLSDDALQLAATVITGLHNLEAKHEADKAQAVADAVAVAVAQQPPAEEPPVE
jgi:hypothetical protein